MTHLRRITASLLIAALASCGNTNKDAPEFTATAADTAAAVSSNNTTPLQAAADTLYNWIGAYQKLDENFTEEKDTAVINNWWRQKLAQVEFYGKPDNIFSLNNGGPHGSAWNPLNDLYIIVTTGEELSGEKAMLLLNGKPAPSIKMMKVKPASETGTIWYGIIPHDTWSASLRKTTMDDLVFIYGKEKADSVSGLQSAVATESVVIIVQVQKTSGEIMTYKGIFQAAYGE